MADEVKMSVKVPKAINDAIKRAAKEDRRSGSSYVGKLLEDHVRKIERTAK